MRRPFQLFSTLALLLLVAACGAGTGETPAADAASSGEDDAAVTTGSGGQPPVASTQPDKELLMAPRDPKMNEKAPDSFRVRFTTTAGDFVIEAHRAWSANGVDRFYNLCKGGYYDGVKLFRVVKGFMAQFGIHGDPKISKWWMNATIQDDTVVKSNQRGFVTYAKTGQPHSRSTQLFVNYGDNGFLDAQGFSPFGEVVEGMNIVDSLYSGYGERTTSEQGSIYKQGNAFLDEKYPELDSIITARVVD